MTYTIQVYIDGRWQTWYTASIRRSYALTLLSRYGRRARARLLNGRGKTVRTSEVSR